MRISKVRDKSNSLDLRYGVSDNSEQASRFLVMVNGRAEWLEKYESLPSDLKIGSDTGFMTFDHRGQGDSGGAQAWIDNYDTYANDMAQVINASTNGKPYNLVCHSMGGLISLIAIMKGLISPRCLVLSAPFLGLPNKPISPTLAYHTSRLLTNLHLGHLNTGVGGYWKKNFSINILTHSAERFSIIQNPPYPTPSSTFQWVMASYEATQFVSRPENIKKLTIPILVLSGTDERVVDPSRTQQWVSEASKHTNASIDFHWVQGGFHELLFESRPIYDTVLTLIKSWFDKKGFPL